MVTSDRRVDGKQRGGQLRLVHRCAGATTGRGPPRCPFRPPLFVVMTTGRATRGIRTGRET